MEIIYMCTACNFIILHVFKYFIVYFMLDFIINYYNTYYIITILKVTCKFISYQIHDNTTLL